MKIRIAFAAIVLAIALPAAAQFRTVQQAYEVQLTNLRLPQSDSGTLGFRPCDGCDFLTKRLSEDARFVLNGKSMSLERFRRGVARVRERQDRYVTVLHHLEKDRITKVELTVPGSNSR